MEPGIQQLDRSVWHPTITHVASADDFKTAFCSPLPIVGTNMTTLEMFPYATDKPKVAYSRSVNFTGWNTQSRMMPVSMAAKEEVIKKENFPDHVPERTFLERRYYSRKEALAYMNSKPSLYSTMQIEQIRTGDAHLSLDHVFVKTSVLIKRHGTDYLKFLGGVVHSPVSNASSFTDLSDPTQTTPAVTPSQHESIPEAPVPIPPSGSGDKPWTGSATKIPVRVVSIIDTLHQTEAAKQPAWSAAATTLISRFSMRDMMNNTLAPSARGMQVRDIPAVSFLLNSVGTTNASWIDTAPLLKGLLYAYPAVPQAFILDKVTAHFIRGVHKTDPQSFRFRWASLTPADLSRHAVKIMTVTLPAFADITRGADPFFNANKNIAVFQTEQLDATWTAIPVTSQMMGVPWLLEYIMMYLPSTIWAGRMNYIWKTYYHRFPMKNFKNKIGAIMSGMPAAHSVHIGGHLNIMLVITDDTSIHSASHVRVGSMSIPVYTGDRRKEGYTVKSVLQYIKTVTGLITDVTTTENYAASAGNMRAAVDTVGRLLSQDGAMRIAVAVASELSSLMPISPSVDYNASQKRYDSTLSGGWCFGGGELSDSTLLLRDAWEGTEKDRSDRMSNLMNGYNFSALSPCCTLATSSVSTRTIDLYDTSKKYECTMAVWSSTKFPHVHSGYRVHTASSLYRVLIGLNMMELEEFSYSIFTLGGLQSTITMQSLVLSLSLSRMCVFNGIGLRMWTGFDMASNMYAAFPFDSLISELTYNVIIQTDPLIVYQIAGLDKDISTYYLSTWEDDTWGHQLPLPYWITLSWSLHFADTPCKSFLQRYESLSRTDFTMLTCIDSITLSGQHLASGTLDHRNLLPVTLLIIGGLYHTYLPQPLDQWSYLTNRMFNTTTSLGHLTSSTLILSIKYHFAETINHNIIRIINNAILGSGQEYGLPSVNLLRYPDPKPFLSQGRPRPNTSDTPSTNPTGGSPSVREMKDSSGNIIPLKTETNTPLLTQPSEEAIQNAIGGSNYDSLKAQVARSAPFLQLSRPTVSSWTLPSSHLVEVWRNREPLFIR